MCLGGQLFQETRSPVQESLLVWLHLLWLLNFPERRMVAADTVSYWPDYTHLHKWSTHVFRILLASVRGNLFYILDWFVLSKLLITNWYPLSLQLRSMWMFWTQAERALILLCFQAASFLWCQCLAPNSKAISLCLHLWIQVGNVTCFPCVLVQVFSPFSTPELSLESLAGRSVCLAGVSLGM